MLVKTFQAETMAEALKKVKAEMGPDAMILSTRKDRTGGFFGFFSKQVIKVTAAIDPNRPQVPPPPIRQKPEREKTAKEEFESSMLAPLARELRDLRDKVDVIARNKKEYKQPELQTGAGQSASTPDSNQQPAVNSTDLSGIPRQELDEIKRLLLENLSRDKDSNVKPVQWPEVTAPEVTVVAEQPETEQKSVAHVDNAKETPLVRALRQQGVNQEAIDKILSSFNGLPLMPGAEGLKKRLGATFDNLIPFAGELQPRMDAPNIIALVGSTGVGKTTTTAKLAALYALNRGIKVALITTDIFRVGAVEQLKTYTRIMGIPLEVAATPKELERAVERHADCELILIDTAGRSHKDTEKLEEMKNFLNASVKPEICLCLSATTKDQELDRILERFSMFQLSKILFTKLDESESIGCIVNLLLKAKLQVAYFTTGQRVPEDIETASPERLAEMVLEGVTV